MEKQEGVNMEQLRIWDIHEDISIKRHKKTGQIIGIGRELTLARFEGGDYLQDSVVVDTITDKLYLKQESRRKRPFKTIDWPLVSYIEIDWELFNKGWIVEKEDAEFQRQKKRKNKIKTIIFKRLLELDPDAGIEKVNGISIKMAYKGEWENMDEKRITMTVEEAVRLLRENPNMTYKEAITKAKGMILDEKVEELEKVN